jgi:broad specificity polyphosphatase/5'/3'-nucleotidase SurE
MTERPRILVSNDDGFQSDGVKTLAAAIKKLNKI